MVSAARAGQNKRHTVANTADLGVSEDIILMIIGEVARNAEVPRRQTVCKGGIVNGLDVHVIIDLA